MSWENYFTEESLLTEELIASGDFAFLNQSKIRIALDNKILSWKKYTSWLQQVENIAALRSDLEPIQIEKLRDKYIENKKTFSHYEIWSDDLVAIELWDEQLIVLGLAPTEKLSLIPNAIFVLCPTNILNQITVTEAKEESKSEDFSEKSKSTKTNLLEFDPLISKPTELNFSNLKVAAPQSETTQTAFSIWNIIETNHLSNTDIARKNFDAFVVLKIMNEQTSVYKMDEDLIKEEINQGLLIYDLKTDNPFTKAFKTQTTQSVNLTDLGLTILDFKYATITPIKLGTEILGFFVGFKISETTTADENILEDISFKNVA
jgi:hypothetical protein